MTTIRMRWAGVTFLAFLFARAGLAQQAGETQAGFSVEALGWMAGDWHGVKGESTIEESWTRPVGETMLGVARTASGGNAIFCEFTKIARDGGRVVMTAHPGAVDKGVPFTLVKQTEGEAVFENPEHDFPTRIVYRYANGELVAIAEGNEGGKVVRDEYHYRNGPLPCTAAQGTRVICKEAVIPAGLAEVWDCWTTTSGVTTFFAPKATIDLTPLGRYELYFDPEAPMGLQGSEGCRVLSYVPQKMLSFEWNAPPHLPGVRKERTWVVIQFEPLSPKSVRVQMTHRGWKTGEEWDKAYEYFQRAWDVVLARLRHRFAGAPIDWSSPYTP